VETPRFLFTYVTKKSKIHLTNIQDTQCTPFIIPSKCTFLFSTNTKTVSPTCFGTCVPSSRRTKSQFS